MSQAMPTETASPARDPLGDPALRRSLEDFVRRRVPSADVDDVVQTVLVEALASPSRPREPGELKRWLLGVARHKVVDLHRRAHREPPMELPDLEGSPAPIEAREMARWAEEQAGSTRDAQKTLAWMAREGEGEKLEAIAAEEDVPAARVRQRVSRMRRWMKERWMAELAAVAMLALLAVAAWWLLRREGPIAHPIPDVPPTIAPEPPSPLDRARSLRADALRACDRGEWRPCLDGLDQARGLDPEGDAAPAVGAARARAADALRAAPPPDTAAPDNGAKDNGAKDNGTKQAPRKGFDKKGSLDDLPDPAPKATSTVPAPKPSPKKPSGGTGSSVTPGGTGLGTGSDTGTKKVLDSDGY
jgi:RNA polymerase sigma factor (sigma-70 family)